MKINKKNAIITFVENTDKVSSKFDPEDIIFSIPYSKVLQAEEFCTAEKLEYCFIGFKKYKWFIQATDNGLNPAIKITSKGLSPEVRQSYITHISEV